MHFFLHGGDSGAACSLSVPQWWALLAERPSVLSGVLGLCGPKEGCTIWDVWEDQVQCWQGTVLIGMGTGAPSPQRVLGSAWGCMDRMVSSSHADTLHQPRSTRPSVPQPGVTDLLKHLNLNANSP